jgi:hypothetical protein
MTLKRRRSSAGSSKEVPASKRSRVKDPQDRFSPLSDEIIIRILHHLPIRTLIACQLISHRLYLLAGDSQIWKNLYYNRFVLPRALRIPGLKSSSVVKQDEALNFASRRSKWLDETTLVNRADGRKTNWKKQYKLRHNWSRGACEVQEIFVADRAPVPAMLVRLAEGVVVTADRENGLRAWDLKGKKLITDCQLEGDAVPTCLAVDELGCGHGKLGIALGFLDGGFGIWRLDVKGRTFVMDYRHPKSSNGALSAVAFAQPYVLTITKSQLLSLYSFSPDIVAADDESQDDRLENRETDKLPKMGSRSEEVLAPSDSASTQPRLLASLKSHTSWPPLSLSIRMAASTIIASIAYSLPTYLSGYTIGLQELHLSTTTGLITSSRLASALPQGFSSMSGSPSSGVSSPLPTFSPGRSRPTALSYSHPYILATNLDNTLTLYLCTSTSTSLSITPGTRLWGHTSSVSSAEITPRGKAVSVSTRGNELRVWELEGGASHSSSAASSSTAASAWASSAGSERERARKRSNKLAERSVQILASPAGAGTTSPPSLVSHASNIDGGGTGEEPSGPEDGEASKRWVGFDEEMVIVLKESGRGTQALMIYDFT